MNLSLNLLNASVVGQESDTEGHVWWTLGSPGGVRESGNFGFHGYFGRIGIKALQLVQCPKL